MCSGVFLLHIQKWHPPHTTTAAAATVAPRISGGLLCVQALLPLFFSACLIGKLLLNFARIVKQRKHCQSRVLTRDVPAPAAAGSNT